jgi:hypothetical protein
MKTCELRFKVERVVFDQDGIVSEEISAIISALSDLQFVSLLGDKNGNQQNSDFDQAFARALGKARWVIEPQGKWPRLSGTADGWDPRPDIVAASPHSNSRFLFEIEKANRYRVWDDIMKLWCFQHEHQCDHGVIICPTKYATDKAERHPYQYARECLSLLRDTAKVPVELLRKITLIGYTQTVWNGQKYVEWDKQICSVLKSQARSTP